MGACLRRALVSGVVTSECPGLPINQACVLKILNLLVRDRVGGNHLPTALRYSTVTLPCLTCINSWRVCSRSRSSPVA